MVDEKQEKTESIEQSKDAGDVASGKTEKPKRRASVRSDVKQLAEKSSAGSADPKKAKTPEKVERGEAREIKGNLPYTASPGSIKNVLDAIIKAERPDKLTNTYMETVFGLSGGGVRSVPPILKKMGFLNSDASPSELYSKFKTDSGRGVAALTGLKSAFPEIFRKNEVAHLANEDQLRDIIVEITGLKKTDPVLRHILNSFSVIRSYVGDAKIDNSTQRQNAVEAVNGNSEEAGNELAGRIGLAYQINIVLPESQDPIVYDAIFRSLKRHLLS